MKPLYTYFTAKQRTIHNWGYPPQLAVARTKALEEVQARLIPASLFHKWTEETNQKGGQVKVPRVMNAEDFRAWEDFVKGQ